MQCFAYCNVKSYNLPALEKIMSKSYNCRLFEDVLQVSLEEISLEKHVFFFSYGSIVFWGLNPEERKTIIEKSQPAAGALSADLEKDEYSFSYGETANITNKFIQLPSKDSMIKLSVSHAIAQSAKLGTFEHNIEKVIRATRHIPQELAKTGKQPYSRKELRRKMGQLYLERSAINLHTDLLDEPEFFWDYEELEPFYAMMRRYLDIQDRVEIINQKLEVVGDLYQMLSEELNHSHFSRLEWIIIWLIAFEIIITIYHYG